MGKGGSQKTTTEVKLPPELVEAAKRNLNLANEVAGIGPAMFNGPSIAGFSPMQMNAMQGTDQAASAFGMPSSVNWQQGSGGQMQAPKGMNQAEMFKALTGMAQPNSSAGGFQGYNTLPGAMQAVNKLPPAQLAAIQAFSMNPKTGAQPANPVMPRLQTPSAQGSSPEGQGNTTAKNTSAQRLRDYISRMKEERMYGGNR